MLLCKNMLSTTEDDIDHLQLIQASASELYNLCRVKLKQLERNSNKTLLKAYAKLRYCSCLLLHSSLFHPYLHTKKRKELSSNQLQYIPDVIRAYQHTSRVLKQYDILEEYEECFQHGLQILDQVETHLQTHSGTCILLNNMNTSIFLH